jgi:hypothetical protein
MAKILTGVQSTGTPHLGNLLGAIIPAIELSNNPENESFLFIADLFQVLFFIFLFFIDNLISLMKNQNYQVSLIFYMVH